MPLNYADANPAYANWIPAQKPAPAGCKQGTTGMTVEKEIKKSRRPEQAT